jgi:hypothetical protein
MRSKRQQSASRHTHALNEAVERQQTDASRARRDSERRRLARIQNLNFLRAKLRHCDVVEGFWEREGLFFFEHLAYVSIRQHTNDSIRLHTSAYVSIRQHTSACISIRQHTAAYVSIRHSSIRQHTSACVIPFFFSTCE